MQMRIKTGKMVKISMVMVYIKYLKTMATILASMELGLESLTILDQMLMEQKEIIGLIF